MLIEILSRAENKTRCSFSFFEREREALEKRGEDIKRRKQRERVEQGTNFSESERRILVSMFCKYSLQHSYFYMLNILKKIARQ